MKCTGNKNVNIPDPAGLIIMAGTKFKSLNRVNNSLDNKQVVMAYSRRPVLTCRFTIKPNKTAIFRI